jgi:hypothetical protein
MSRALRVDLFPLWVAHMRRGDFEAAWRISDQSREVSCGEQLPRHLQPVWRGASLRDKHVLIRCYRGLGDTIQFIRYAPVVKALATTISIAAQPELIPLLHTMRAFDRIVALEDNSDAFGYDVDLEVTELPYIFRTSSGNIPCGVPYFDVTKAAPLPSGKNLSVGIVWAAGDWDRRRSLSPVQLAPLATIPGVRLYSFQRGAGMNQSVPPAVKHLVWRDILHEAALMRALDLLISVDTMPAHFAGALGVPVWLLLHADSDWRWMTERDDSPWYPTMRLFRQKRSRDWQPVIEQVTRALRNLGASANLQKKNRPAGSDSGAQSTL